MASCPRKEVFREGEVGTYHVWTRCVRRWFLCGADPLTGKDYEHRRDWIHAFLRRLAALFGVEVGFHAEMANHLHLVLRARPDVVDTWSDEEVARRSLTIERLIKSQDGETTREVGQGEVAIEMGEADRIVALRGRLSHISWFMKALCEHIGRRANREDRCTGHFFEGRFDCRDLTSEAAILVCGIYVDLNQIHAGEAMTPEESTHTSAYERIQSRLADEPEPTSPASGGIASDESPSGWMCELPLQQDPDVDLPSLSQTQSSRRASEKGLLPVSLEEYLAMLDWTGRQVRCDKRGAIPDGLAPILERLGINDQLWTELTTHFDRYFGRIVGRAADVAARAAQAGRRYYRGQGTCAAAFG